MKTTKTNETFSIDKAKLLQLLDLVSLDKELSQKECLLAIDNNKLTTYLCTSDKSFVIRAELSNKFGLQRELGLKDLNELTKCLNNFGDKLQFTLEEDKLICEETNQKVSIKIKKPDYIVNQADSEKIDNRIKALEKLSSFDLKKEILVDAVKILSPFQPNKIKVAIKNKLVSFYTDSTSTENKIIKSYSINSKTSDISFTISQALLTLFNTLKEYDIRCYVDDKNPTILLVRLLNIQDLNVDYLLGLKVESNV